MSELNIEEVGLVITLRCTSRCRICGTSSHPGHTAVMPLEKGTEYLNQISSVPSIKLVGFTGGEPFLFFDKLSELMGHTQSLGLVSKVATNAFWAKTFKDARAALAQLKNNGLEILCISADTYHQEFIPVKRVMNAIGAALELEINLAITFIHGPGHGEGFDNFVEALQKSGFADRLIFMRNMDQPLRQFMGANYFKVRSQFRDRILIRESTVLCAGRAQEFKDECYFSDVDELSKQPCIHAGRIMAVLPSGRLLWCCSPAAFDDNSFHVGDLNSESFDTLLKKVRKDSVIEYLATQGPYYMMKSLKELGCHFDDKYSGDCHLCAQMFREIGKETIAEKLEKSNTFETLLMKAIRDRMM